jgi:cholesterol oxidase
MATDFDAIVVGSGFGGSVVAARLAERGYRVLVLERGRRWQVHEYPRKPGDAWLWDDRSPERCNGWFDFRMFPNMSVVQGAGVGGGSLVYANISIDAKQATFQNGWPPEIRWNDLQTYYARVKGMLRNEPVPDRQWPHRTDLVREAATNLGWGSKFERLDLAVTFDPAWHYGLPDPHNHSHSKSFTNPQGQQQGTCVHLGECDIGCPVKARNTLDLTYIPLAERHHADVRPLHIVRSIAPEPEGYRLHYDRIANGTLASGSASGRLVILSAGSLGSTELLLRCRDIHGTLTNLSPRLGQHWSSNGDFLTPAIHPFRNVQPTRGPTITSAIDLLDGTVNGRDIFIEDGGFPDIARGFMQQLAGMQGDTEQETVLIESVQWLTRLNLFRNLMPWFAQARDAADGVLSLKDGRLFLHWDVAQSEATINAVVETHQRLAMSTGGAAIVPPAWAWSKDLITPHPLGGAKMGTSRENGVVDHKGEVFGHRNLFVADGAIVPKALGLNPSKTIAALAERVAEFIAVEGR